MLTTSSFGQLPIYVPNEGLIGYWGFSGDANDESGKGIHGIIDGANLVDDRFGNHNSAYGFDGMNDKIIIAQNNQISLVATDAFSINIWVRQTALENKHGNPHHTVYSSKKGVVNGIVCYVSPEEECLFYLEGDVNKNTMVAGNSELNVWKMHTIVYDGQNSILKIYSDGILTEEVKTDLYGGLTSSEFFLGERNDYGLTNTFFQGELDDFGVWGRALTECEISNLFTTDIPNSTDIQVACLPYTWIDGKSYNTSNFTATHRLTNSSGCDSIVTLNLTIIDSNEIYDLKLAAGSSTNDVRKNSLLFPNPSNGHFTIDLGEFFRKVKISITDLNGKIIQTNEYFDAQVVHLEIEEAAAVYYVIVETGNRREVLKLIKD